MYKICYFLSINNDWLNPFKCSETIGNYEGRGYRWYMTLLGWTTDYRGWPTDYGRWTRYVGRWPKFVSFKSTRTDWIHLNVLKWFWIIKGRWLISLIGWRVTYRLQRMTYRLWKMTYRLWKMTLRPINFYCSHHFRTLKWIQTGLVSLNINFLVIFRHASVIFRSL